MRRLTFLLAVSALLAMPSLAQQTNENKAPSEQQQKKAAKQPSAQKATETKKPDEATAKTTEPAPSQPEPKAADDKDKKEEHFDMTEVAPIVTHHQITVDGKTLKYTATTGRLPIKRGDGKIEAEMFFVAYSLDGQDAAKRPLTFAFNGGPGSASIWLHMGALGPRRVALPPDGSPAGASIQDGGQSLHFAG